MRRFRLVRLRGWGSLYEHLNHDESENGIGNGQAITFQANRNVIHAPKRKD